VGVFIETHYSNCDALQLEAARHRASRSTLLRSGLGYNAPECQHFQHSRAMYG